jgi:TBC1 domain family member 20
LRKDEVLKLGNNGGDAGMIHSILTGLPNLTDYSKFHDDDQSKPSPDPAVPEYSDSVPLSGADDSPVTDEVSKTCNTSEFHSHSCMGPSSSNCSPRRDEDVPSAIAADNSPVLSLPKPEIFTSPPPDALDAPASFDPADIPLPPSAAPTPPESPPESPESSHAQTAYSLSNVLLLADKLFSLFPPSAPDLHLTYTLGPASAMRTWAQEAALLPSDDQAEALVVAGVDFVVRDAFEPTSQSKEQQRAKIGRKRRVNRGETRLIVAGAVLVLGAAVVVGIHSRRGGPRDADWRTLFDTFGAFGERMLGMFGEAHLGL